MPHLKIWQTDWCRESRDISRIKKVTVVFFVCIGTKLKFAKQNRIIVKCHTCEYVDYENELEEEFSSASIKAKKIDADYDYSMDSAGRRFLHFFYICCGKE